MAKKKTAGSPPGNESTITPRRRTTRRADPAAGAPVDISSVASPEPVDTAPDLSSRGSAEGNGAASQPSHEDIARAAYQRYLQRGGSDGLDFDDWVEAERELKGRSPRS